MEVGKPASIDCFITHTGDDLSSAHFLALIFAFKGLLREVSVERKKGVFPKLVFQNQGGAIVAGVIIDPKFEDFTLVKRMYGVTDGSGDINSNVNISLFLYKKITGVHVVTNFIVAANTIRNVSGIKILSI